MGPAKSFVCFSDIDGTLVHYPGPEELAELERDEEMLILPASGTGRLGVISQATLRLCASIRASGVHIAIVSGARTPTVLARLPYLPAADAIVSENGGRIFYPDPNGVTAAPLVEDLEWRRDLQPVAGPARQDGVAPEEREGLLWDYYRALKGDGWQLDALGYATAFRLKATPGKSQSDLQAAIDSRPPYLKCTFNLGVADFYPSASGKEGAAAHLMRRWGVAGARDAALLCDDDNDLSLAAEVGRVFLPSIAEDSVARAVKANPSHFVVADRQWMAGTEQMLAAVSQHFRAMQEQADTAAAPVATSGGSAAGGTNADALADTAHPVPALAFA